MRTLLLIVLLSFVWGTSAQATTLENHFFGDASECRFSTQPVFLVVDVTLTGEIDDTVSLYMYRALELRGCIRVSAVIPIFGNGGSSTAEVYENLLHRLEELQISWRVLRGPNHKAYRDVTATDLGYLRKIAEAIAAESGPVVIAELGPITVSARLLSLDLVSPTKIKQILGVGGRAPGEQFLPPGQLAALVTFRDFNVAEDRAAVGYLLRHHSEKLWLVTWRTGIGTRMLKPDQLVDFPAKIAEHANERASKLQLIGYRGLIPSWDTWTTSYFVNGGPERLGCLKTAAALRRFEGGNFRPSDQIQLQLGVGSSRVTACHQTAQ